ncbi:MAG: PIN domain-containing protein [Patescibacteria group bacterium]
MKIIIDASVFIDYLRRKQRLDTLYAQIQFNNELVTSIVILGEVYSGKSAQLNGEQRETIEEIVNGIEIISPTLKTAQHVGSLRYSYDMSLGDAFIAALAIELTCPLATLNSRHFQKIPSLSLFTPHTSPLP